MCGINGFNFKNPDLINKMCELTKHRGPDRTDFWCGENISIGHNRLSIIDLSAGGNQPMWDEKREFVIVFNGEIYNFLELRSVLEKKYSFCSASDTEVILYAYREWGADCVKKFNGIFAFALWDTCKQELFLARDHLGVKPLYYFYDPSASSGQTKFIFSSEIKAILAHNIPREVNREAFNLYFQLLYTPEPHTMFLGINKLPSASYLLLDKEGKARISEYWKPTDFSDLDSYDETRSTIKDIFNDSVKRQLISDRPVGVFLSGGLDSTAVLGAASEFHCGKLKTFSVGFKDSQNHEKFNADFLLAKKTAEFYSTDHNELLIGPKDIQNSLENIVWHLDEPNFNPTAGAVFLLSQVAKEKVAVVLGGDGGDELFGGYPRYYYSRLISKFQSLPRSVQITGRLAFKIAGRIDIINKLSLPPDKKRILAFLAQKDVLLSQLIVESIYRRDASEIFLAKNYDTNELWRKDFEKQFMNVDRQGWLVDESLMRTDKMSMAFGLEERVPILDFRLVELSIKIPTSWKFKIWNKIPSDFQGKLIWRDAIQDYLPAHILNEKKRGWFTPMAKWLRADLHDYVTEILSPDNLNNEYFNVAGVQKVWKDHLSGTRYNLNIIWAIVMWQLWYNRFIKNSYKI